MSTSRAPPCLSRKDLSLFCSHATPDLFPRSLHSFSQCSQRTREIGVRMALGAQRSSVYRLILKEAGCLIAAGIFAGLICSVVATTLMHSLLFGVQSWDVMTLATVSGVLAVSALLASYIPAHRAASVNPVEALGAE